MFWYGFFLQILEQCDDLLFSIVVLGCLSQADGTVWRRSMAHICVIEVTIPEKSEHCAARLLNLLPSSKCLRPINIKPEYSTEGESMLNSNNFLLYAWASSCMCFSFMIVLIIAQIS